MSFTPNQKSALIKAIQYLDSEELRIKAKKVFDADELDSYRTHKFCDLVFQAAYGGDYIYAENRTRNIDCAAKELTNFLINYV